MTGTVNVFEAARRLGLGDADRLRELGGRLRPRTARRAGHALRRLQARERGNGGGLRGRARRRQRRPQAVHRLRAGPRPGHDRRADAGDRGRRAGRALPDRVRRRDAVPLRRRRRPRVRPGGALGAGAARRPSASAARPRRSRTSSRSSAGEVPGARDLVSTTPSCPSRTSCPSPGSTRPLTPLEEGVRETAVILRSVV